jgi:competence protein ComEC
MTAGPTTHAGPRPRAPRYQPLVIVLAAACVGIAADRYWPLPLAAWWLVTLGTCCVWLVLWRRGRLHTALAMLLLAAAAAAAGWHHARWYLFAADDLGQFARAGWQPVCIEARALKTPRMVPPVEVGPMSPPRSGDRVRLEVELLALRDGADWRPVSGRAQLSVVGRLPKVEAGDRLRVFAHMQAPPPPHNPGEFDLAAQLRGRRVRSQLRTDYPEAVSRLAAGSPWGLSRWLEKVRVGGNRLFKKYLDPKRSELAAAVLLGAREQLEPDRIEPFMETGTIHLLVIAGLHLGILAGFMLMLVRRLPIARTWALAGVALGTVLYALLVDAQPPVIRATVLVVVMCGAALLGRRSLGFNSLALAALIVLAVNPGDLFRAGPQLSFLSVAGLVWLGPRFLRSAARQDPLERLIWANLGRLPRTMRQFGLYIRNMAVCSLIIWLVTMPLVMARFHLFTPVSVLANTLAFPPMALALVSGFVTLVVGGLCPPLATLSGGLCNASLWLVEGMVTLAQRVPLGHFWVPGPADWWLAGFYGGLGLLAAFPRLRPPRRWRLGLLAAWILAGFAAAGLPTDHSRLQCTFLSVGHGGAEVLELPSGRTMLYDAGQFGAPLAATRAIAGYLWSRGITHIDAVVLSHADVDHYNGLPGVLERFSVGVIYVTPQMFEKQNPAIRALHKAIVASGTPLREVWAGNRLDAGADCTLEVLHPPRQGVLGNDNANCLVLLVNCRQRRILLTGDLAPPGLDDVMAEQPLCCDVLLVPHHGSRQSEPASLAAWSRPHWAIISADRRLDLRPVVATYQAVGSRVLHTAETGAVSVTIDPSGMRVEEFLRR